MGPIKTHKILDIFKEKFPQMKEQIAGWGVGDSNSIRINMEDHSMYVFTYISEDEWSLETLKLYAKRIDR